MATQMNLAKEITEADSGDRGRSLRSAERAYLVTQHNGRLTLTFQQTGTLADRLLTSISSPMIGGSSVEYHRAPCSRSETPSDQSCPETECWNRLSTASEVKRAVEPFPETGSQARNDTGINVLGRAGQERGRGDWAREEAEGRAGRERRPSSCTGRDSVSEASHSQPKERQKRRGSVQRRQARHEGRVTLLPIAFWPSCMGI